MYEGLELNQQKSIYAMLSLKGKKALVTGAAGGIGRACAAALAEAGADVALMDIAPKAGLLEENAVFIQKKFNVQTMELVGDVSDLQSVQAMYLQIEEGFGTIDIIFSNAGVLTKNDSSTIELADWKRALDINLTGMFLVDQVGAEMMKRHRHGGSIINTASMSASIVNRSMAGNTAMVAYTSTKAAVVHLTKSMSINYIEDGIRFNCISPGYVLSGLHVNVPKERMDFMQSTVPLKRFGTLDEVVGAVVYLASDLSSYCIGTDLVLDGGYSIW